MQAQKAVFAHSAYNFNIGRCIVTQAKGFATFLIQGFIEVREILRLRRIGMSFWLFVTGFNFFIFLFSFSIGVDLNLG